MQLVEQRQHDRESFFANLQFVLQLRHQADSGKIEIVEPSLSVGSGRHDPSFADPNPKLPDIHSIDFGNNLRFAVNHAEPAFPARGL